MTFCNNFEKAISFINEIGIETVYKSLAHDDCFLPGLLIADGRILIDHELLLYPGDLLHEAAHIALVPEEERGSLTATNIGNRKDAAAEEMAAIAWSFAACIHFDISPSFVFHEKGYKGDGLSIAGNFKNGNYFGVPILQWLGMTGIGDCKFPAMIKWTRD